MSSTQPSFSEMSLTDLETFIFANVKPRKPIRPQPPTSDRSRASCLAFADDLDRYEESMVEYNNAMEIYQASADAAQKAWMGKLKEAVAKDESQDVFMRAYEYAYHQHHSDGLFAVREAMFPLMDLVRAVRNLR